MTRRGHTLIELLISTVTASVVLGGMASSLYVASQALDLDDGEIATRTRNSRALSRMLSDVRHALSFSEIGTHSLTFTVPDRDGDNSPETIRYAWSGNPRFGHSGMVADLAVDEVHFLDPNRFAEFG